jgi:hypothetical protein
MDRLSTEIDEHIIGRLDKAALDALSQTSKYYRTLAEAHLYRDLTFSINRPCSITLLCFTLLKRPELALYIQSCSLNEEMHNQRFLAFTDNFYNEFWNTVTVVKNAIDNITRSQPTRFALRWLSRVLQDAPIIDGQLAIILCLATNLEQLTLVRTRGDLLPITLEALNACWVTHGCGLQAQDEEAASAVEYFEDGDEVAASESQDGQTLNCGENDEKDQSDGDSGDECPFSKLKSLSINEKFEAGSCAPLLPSLDTLQLKESLGLFSFPYASTGRTGRLQTLQITKVSLDIPTFENVIGDPGLRGLKELIVREVEPNWEDNYYDFSHMSDAITACLPDLRRLEWSRNNHDREWGELRPFGSFKGLVNLVDLTVDYELITPTRTQPNLQPVHERPAHLPSQEGCCMSQGSRRRNRIGETSRKGIVRVTGLLRTEMRTRTIEWEMGRKRHLSNAAGESAASS